MSTPTMTTERAADRLCASGLKAATDSPAAGGDDTGSLFAIWTGWMIRHAITHFTYQLACDVPDINAAVTEDLDGQWWTRGHNVLWLVAKALSRLDVSALSARYDSIFEVIEPQ
ncbi:MAG: hypothetical protein ABI777_13875 [Betaproteobacteria bacterium]